MLAEMTFRSMSFVPIREHTKSIRNKRNTYTPDTLQTASRGPWQVFRDLDRASASIPRFALPLHPSVGTARAP